MFCESFQVRVIFSLVMACTAIPNVNASQFAVAGTAYSQNSSMLQQQANQQRQDQIRQQQLQYQQQIQQTRQAELARQEQIRQQQIQIQQQLAQTRQQAQQRAVAAQASAKPTYRDPYNAKIGPATEPSYQAKTGALGGQYIEVPKENPTLSHPGSLSTNQATINQIVPVGPSTAQRAATYASQHKADIFMNGASMLTGGGELRLAGMGVRAVEGAVVTGMKNNVILLDGGTATVKSALSQGEKWIGNGYQEIADGVFRSKPLQNNEGFNQFRIITDNVKNIKNPHVNFERVSPNGRDIIFNSHLRLEN